MINKKINIDKQDSNTTVHAVYGCTSTVPYGIRPYRLPYCQLITQTPDSMSAGAVKRHGVQPYLPPSSLYICTTSVSYPSSCPKTFTNVDIDNDTVDGKAGGIKEMSQPSACICIKSRGP